VSLCASSPLLSEAECVARDVSDGVVVVDASPFLLVDACGWTSRVRALRAEMLVKA
jgi:hypothetical protein